MARKPRLKRLEGIDFVPEHIAYFKGPRSQGGPMECVNCDYKYVTPRSLDAKACPLCRSTQRAPHRTLEAFPEVNHGWA